MALVMEPVLSFFLRLTPPLGCEQSAQRLRVGAGGLLRTG
jgi:hypothetical protein